MVCLVTARDFRAVGLFYEDFSQVSDKEVQRLLRCGKGDFPSPPT
jgi:predicted phosphoribosyltransferase